MASDLTQCEYVVLLQRMHAFHTAIEPAIARASIHCAKAAVLLDRRRLDALDDDLIWFDAMPVAPPQMPEFAVIAAALGALYVVEGSGLGGRVIARHLANSLGVTPGRGGSFYGRLSAEGARIRWARLTTLLTEQPHDPESCVAVSVLAAQDTFDRLERWLRADLGSGVR